MPADANLETQLEHWADDLAARIPPWTTAPDVAPQRATPPPSADPGRAAPSNAAPTAPTADAARQTPSDGQRRRFSRRALVGAATAAMLTVVAVLTQIRPDTVQLEVGTREPVGNQSAEDVRAAFLTLSGTRWRVTDTSKIQPASGDVRAGGAPEAVLVDFLSGFALLPNPCSSTFAATNGVDAAALDTSQCGGSAPAAQTPIIFDVWPALQHVTSIERTDTTLTVTGGDDSQIDSDPRPWRARITARLIGSAEPHEVSTRSLANTVWSVSELDEVSTAGEPPTLFRLEAYALAAAESPSLDHIRASEVRSDCAPTHPANTPDGVEGVQCVGPPIKKRAFSPIGAIIDAATTVTLDDRSIAVRNHMGSLRATLVSAPVPAPPPTPNTPSTPSTTAPLNPQPSTSVDRSSILAVVNDRGRVLLVNRSTGVVERVFYEPPSPAERAWGVSLSPASQPLAALITLWPGGGECPTMRLVHDNGDIEDLGPGSAPMWINGDVLYGSMAMTGQDGQWRGRHCGVTGLVRRSLTTGEQTTWPLVDSEARYTDIAPRSLSPDGSLLAFTIGVYEQGNEVGLLELNTSGALINVARFLPMPPDLIWSANPFFVGEKLIASVSTRTSLADLNLTDALVEINLDTLGSEAAERFVPEGFQVRDMDPSGTWYIASTAEPREQWVIGQRDGADPVPITATVDGTAW
ncbi:MAG: hypothetical protein ACKV2O_10720 [Acidimicrobiales bacterium]